MVSQLCIPTQERGNEILSPLVLQGGCPRSGRGVHFSLLVESLVSLSKKIIVSRAKSRAKYAFRLAGKLNIYQLRAGIELNIIIKMATAIFIFKRAWFFTLWSKKKIYQ